MSLNQLSGNRVSIILYIFLMTCKLIVRCQEEEAQGNIIVSMIYGIGIPWDVEGGYMTTGYVIRVQYAVPMKIKDWKSPYAKYFKNRRSVPASNRTYMETIAKPIDNEYLKTNNNQARHMNKDKGKNNQNIDQYRWAAYHALEVHAKRLGYEGRTCVLRAICEAAVVQFDWRSGLLGELLHILLTPSTSSDPLTKHSDNEYLHAEHLGKSGAPCHRIFRECSKSLLDQFSGIYTENVLLNM